jgi:uncharacterized protein (TIGR02001 family)
MHIRTILLTFMAILFCPTTELIASDLTANIGYACHYIFRGIPQDKSSLFGGLDYTHEGVCVGTWAGDVNDGLEVDPVQGV